MVEENEFLADLRAFIARHYVTQSAAAKHWKVSRSYLSSVVKGNTPPNKKILDEVGYDRSKKVQVKVVYNKTSTGS